MAGSLTGLERFHKSFDLPLGPVLHTHAAHYFWGAEKNMSEYEYSKKYADALNSLIESEGPDTVAAFIAGPVMGTGGVVPPTEGYWGLIQKVLNKHDVLLIADEVVCGFGRSVVAANYRCDIVD